MSNSKLATWKWSGKSDHYNVRDHKIDKITIHHMAGNATLAGCCSGVQSRGGSVNYCIDSSGTIGVMIDEQYRAWTSSNRDNDMRAVTIEVANAPGAGEPDWKVTDKALEACIKLCVDICRRNGIKALNYTGNTSGNLTMHKWFAATGCPGPYLSSKFPYIAAEVNKRLNGDKAEDKPAVLYRVRKTWADEKSQIGAYKSLESAKQACKSGYKVYDDKGNVVYEAEAAPAPKLLDTAGSKYGDKTDSVHDLKRALTIAHQLNMVAQTVDDNNVFGKGTELAVNSLLRKWGYAENGIAGAEFRKRLFKEILKKL